MLHVAMVLAGGRALTHLKSEALRLILGSASFSEFSKCYPIVMIKHLLIIIL